MEEFISNGNTQGFLHYITHNPAWCQYRNAEGNSFLHLSVRFGNFELASICIEHNHPLDLINNQGDTALHLSVSHTFPNIFRLLLKNNANSAIFNKEGSAAIHKSIENNNKLAILEFINFGCDLNLKNSDGESALHLAIDLNLTEIIEILIKNRVDVEDTDSDGNRPLHLACKTSNITALKLLIDAKARIDITNNRGESPLSLCLKHKSTEALYLLLNTGLLIKEEDLKLAREVSKPSIWEDISTIFKKQSQYMFKSIDSHNTALSTLDFEDLKPFNHDSEDFQAKETSEILQKNYILAQNIIEIEGLELLECIGRGEYSEVFRSKWRYTDIAVKKFYNHKDFSDELQILKSIRHPNIILLMGVCVNPPLLITEYMDFGSLSSLLHSDYELSLKQQIKISIQILQGLLFLHTSNPSIVHRDLKSANCLVNSQLTVKICDFGLAKIKDTTLQDTQTFGTFPYMAPEVISEQKYSIKSDIYAFGILLWEILHRKKPLEDLAPVQIVYQVVHLSKRPMISKGCGLKELIENCWGSDSGSRPSGSSIYKELNQYYYSL